MDRTTGMDEVTQMYGSTGVDRAHRDGRAHRNGWAHTDGRGLELLPSQLCGEQREEL